MWGCSGDLPTVTIWASPSCTAFNDKSPLSVHLSKITTRCFTSQTTSCVLALFLYAFDL